MGEEFRQELMKNLETAAQALDALLETTGSISEITTVPRALIHNTVELVGQLNNYHHTLGGIE